MEHSILLSHRDHPSRPELIIVTSGPSEITREDVPQLIRRKGPIDQAADECIIMMFAPLQPELATRTDSGVERLVLVGRDQQLDGVEQRGDRSRRLVGDQLTDPFHDLHTRGLVFDHTERDAIDQQDNVAAARVRPVLLPDRLLILRVAFAVVTVDRKFRASLEKVVLGLVPVDEAHRVALLIAFDRLRNRRAQDQALEQHLVRPHQPALNRRIRAKLTDRLRGVGGIKRVFRAPVGVAVDLQQLVDHHRLQQHTGRAAAKAFAFGLRQDFPAHRGQHHQSRHLGGVHLRRRHDFSFVRHYLKVMPPPGPPQ